jgi:hypothetical protein
MIVVEPLARTDDTPVRRRRDVPYQAYEHAANALLAEIPTQKATLVSCRRAQL